MAALATDPNKRRRLMVELLARTGMRSGELAGLESDAMVRIGDTHWLRIPVGKLHNDRYVPLHPLLVELITDWLATRPPSHSGRLVARDDGQPFDRRTIHRYVVAAAKRAGVGHVHPHQLRHTLATQAINRGMSLEAIAALLGHYAGDPVKDQTGLRPYEACSSRRLRRPSKIFCRPTCPLAAASSRWRCRVGRNSIVVWKNVHDSQMDSKWQSRPTGRAQ
jgi:integrase